MTNQHHTELEVNEIRQAMVTAKNLDVKCQEMDKICQKAYQKSLTRRMRMECQEEEFIIRLQKAQEARNRQLAETEQEQKLAQAMAELKHREMVEIKNKQLLQNNSHDMRHLEKQLQKSYAKKELMCQLKEKEAMKTEEKVREYYSDLKMIDFCNKGNQLELENQARQQEYKLENSKVIAEQRREAAEKQLEMLNCRRSFKYEQDEIKGNGNCKGKSVEFDYYQKEKEEFLKIKNEKKENERIQVEQMERRIEEYLNNVNERTRKQEVIRIRKIEEKDRIYKTLVDIHKSAMRSDNSDIKIVLAQEEQRNADLLAVKMEKKLRKQEKEQLLKQNDMQLKIKNDKIEAEKDKDLAEAKQLLQKFENLNEKEEILNNVRRQMMMKYGRELKETINQKNKLRNKQRITRKNEYSEFIKTEELKKTEFENEQNSIVRQHIGELAGFFPPCGKPLIL